MMRFYCDRCATEVEGPDDLLEVQIEGRERPNLANWIFRAEVCRSCFESLRESITALMGTSDETKKKPGRRTAP
ncbi:MAG: hypothetical protein QOD06_628 [Candidatus Binatota bacterium]|jgi:hypothetical protein|nr:hypothetical protein [Candidatus Binatota bacterium]